MRNPYRLALDIGTHSIGWCLLSVDDSDPPVPTGLIRAGVRIFPDGRSPTDKQSLAVNRRLARQQRRRRDRFLKRRDRVMALLIKHGLMPADASARHGLAALDPWELRARGLDQPLTPHELGRALFHLNRRRGFRSNRRLDRSDEKESGKIKSAIGSVAEAVAGAGCRTVGEWLARRHRDRLGVRARLLGTGVRAIYDLYLSREMTAAEFDALWAAQAPHHPALLTAAARDEIRDAIFFQRRLRPVQPGRCTFEPDEERAPLALPTMQRLRIYQELNHLRVILPDYSERALTRAERDLCAQGLCEGRDLTFVRMRRLLGLSGAGFNLESEKREKLKGDGTARVMADARRFGAAWQGLTLAQQDEVVRLWLATESEGELADTLAQRWGLGIDAALAVSTAPLPEGYAALSAKAADRVFPALEAEVCSYDKACAAAGYDHHGETYDGVVEGALPYYGLALQRHVAFGSGIPGDPDEKRYGRIANPTVHIGLNQIRVLVNAIIGRYGHPREIYVEFARDLKLPLKVRQQIEKEQAENQKRNEKIGAKLEELGLRNNGENRLRFRLWEELNRADVADRRCPYSGEVISITRLFSAEVEVEHILPFALTLDDSGANKTVALRRANRDKGNRPPYEAFGHSPPGYEWEAIRQRAEALPANKRWRFGPDAMERFLRDEQDFLARQLTDTAYVCRLAKLYLSRVCPPARIWATPGRLTALLRGRWGLNGLLSDSETKDRTDHRHHAIDAIVIGVSDRRLLQAVATAAGRAREREMGRLLEDMPIPWPGFREELAAKLPRVVVSYRPDHGYQGQLHNDTAYGLVEDMGKGLWRVVHRKALADLKPGDLEKIADARLAEALSRVADGAAGDADLRARLAAWGAANRVRRVRIIEVLSVMPMAGGRGDGPYKGYKGDSNYCLEVWRDATGRWQELVVSTFEANQIESRSRGRLRDRKRAQNGEPLVMRLCRNDLVAVGEGASRRIMRVARLSPGQIALAEHFEGNVDARARAKAFRYLFKTAGSLAGVGGRRVFVDVLGRVLDPGFRP